jgi:ABC-2 type transport system ATP-binding protein
MLNINHLTFNYPGKQALLRDLTLELKAGHIYGLLGENGAGKSTLLKNMVGIAFPGKGSCLFNGDNVANRPVSVLEDIYFIPEELYVPSLTPAQFVGNTVSFYPGFSAADFFTYLEMLGVDRNGIMDNQSYGQQKKAMIAFGLATRTSLIIMDEPTNGLDIPSKIKFRKLIASVQTENRCILISTHQVRDLDNLIDTVLVLHGGSIVVNRSIDEMLEKLTFGTYADTSHLPVLYEEENIRGKNAILRNISGAFSKPDLELLFNAIICGNQPLLEILKES